MQQLQIWADQAGVSFQIYIANNLPMVKQLLDQAGQYGSVVHDYFASGQAAKDVESGLKWIKDKVKSGAHSVRNWFNKILGGGSASPGNPNNWNHRDYFLNQASNKELRNAISELYRKTASIGDGGTADALRSEIQNGQYLKHLQKAQNSIEYLNRILRTQALTETERKLTYQLLNDLYDAVKQVPK